MVPFCGREGIVYTQQSLRRLPPPSLWNTYLCPLKVCSGSTSTMADLRGKQWQQVHYSQSHNETSRAKEWILWYSWYMWLLSVDNEWDFLVALTFLTGWPSVGSRPWRCSPQSLWPGQGQTGGRQPMSQHQSDYRTQKKKWKSQIFEKDKNKNTCIQISQISGSV